MVGLADVHVNVGPEVQSPVSDAMALAAAAATFNAVLSPATLNALTDREAEAVADLQAVMRRITTKRGYVTEEQRHADHR